MTRTKLAAFLVPLVALTLTAQTPLGISKQGDEVVGGYEDFSRHIRDLTDARPTVDSAIPWVAVRFDDNRDGAYDNGEIAGFLRLGIPVTLAINADQMGTAGNSTWGEIRDLIALSHQFEGAEIEIAQHGNTNLAEGLETTYKELIDNLTTGTRTNATESNEIERELGGHMVPRVYVQPGDPAPKTFAMRNRGVMASVLDSLNFEFALMTHSAADSTGMVFNHPHALATDQLTTPNQIWGFRPGDVHDPYFMPEAFTVDLGNRVVERSGSEWTERYGITTSSWLLKDKSGVGGSPDLDGETTWQNLLYSRLGSNLGFVVAMHDSAATDAETPTGLTGVSVGHFSPAHIAGTLKRLEERGHIKLVTLSDWCRWVTSGGYRPGTDLIANPGMLMPQFDIGDTSGVEYNYIRGLGSLGFAANAHSGLSSGGTLATLKIGTNAKYIRTGDTGANSTHPAERVGASVTGYAGRPGGLLMASTGISQLTVGIGQLAPGRYRFSIMTSAENDLTIKELHLSVASKAFQAELSWENGGASVYTDTLVTYTFRDIDRVITENAGGQWHELPLEFVIPDNPSGEGFGNQLYGVDVDTEYAALYQRLWLDQTA